MVLVTDVLDRIARECSLNSPTSWITATDDTYKEIRDDFLMETIDDLQNRIDWPEPIGKQAVLAGDGTEDYTLPSDFRRLKNDRFAVYETDNVRRTCFPVSSDGEWTHLKEFGSGAGSRFYRLKGYDGNFEVQLYPNPSSGESVTISYVSNLWMATSGGTAGATFSDADDVLLIPRRLLELGTIYRWRNRKGLDYLDIQKEYEQWVASIANRAASRRIVDMGEPMARKPFDVPVPDFIPSS